MIANLFYLFWVVVSTVLFFCSYHIPVVNYGFTGPGTFPKVLTFILLIFSGVLFVSSLRQKQGYDESLILNRKQFFVLVGCIVYIVMIQILGYILSTFIYTFFTISFLMPKKTPKELFKALMIAGVSIGIIYYIFAVKLNVFLPAAVWE